MSVYSDHVLPRIIDIGCGTKSTMKTRRHVCAGLKGRVVEIGFGSGLNVPCYPATVGHVDAVEPSDLGWKLASKRVGAARVQIVRAGLDGQSLPFDDDTFDSALSTWTLCTIPDVNAALAELARVLKPGGEFHFVEHGRAPDQSVRVWQSRLEPINKRLLGGCHLSRPIVDLIEGNGFRVSSLETFYEEGVPKPFVALSLGVATA